MVDVILLAATFASIAFLFLVVLPFFERPCPWLAALVADALAMRAALFATPDATMYIGWIFQLGYEFVALDCFQHFCGGEALFFMGSAPASAENEFGYESETPDSASGAGLENEFHFNVSEISGPVTGARVENELPFHELETSGPGAGSVNGLFKELAARGQVRRHAHPVGLWHAPSFQQFKFPVPRVSPGNLFSGFVDTNVNAGLRDSGSGVVLDGIFMDTIDFEDSEAATVPGMEVDGSGVPRALHSGCYTAELQPADIAIQQPLKHSIKQQAMQFFAESVCRDDAMLDFRLNTMKRLMAHWVLHACAEVEKNTSITTKAWRHLSWTFEEAPRLAARATRDYLEAHSSMRRRWKRTSSSMTTTTMTMLRIPRARDSCCRSIHSCCRSI